MHARDKISRGKKKSVSISTLPKGKSIYKLKELNLSLKDKGYKLFLVRKQLGIKIVGNDTFVGGIKKIITNREN